MKHSISWLVACAAVPAAIAVYCPDAKAQEVVTVYPPSSYVAAYEPVYYNGFAHYLWRDHWYYRDHGAWHWWRNEPAGLHTYRGGWAHRWHHW